MIRSGSPRPPEQLSVTYGLSKAPSGAVTAPLRFAALPWPIKARELMALVKKQRPRRALLYRSSLTFASRPGRLNGRPGTSVAVVQGPGRKARADYFSSSSLPAPASHGRSVHIQSLAEADRAEASQQQWHPSKGCHAYLYD